MAKRPSGLRVASLIAAAALAAPALASTTYRIDFYRGDLSAANAADWDWDGDGVVDYSGTFVAPDTSGGAVKVTAFSVTIDGVSYDTLRAPGAFPGPPSYAPAGAWPIAYVDGFVFDAPIVDPDDTVTALQMSSFGIDNTYYDGWSLSPCTPRVVCGGAEYLGMFTITALDTPLPTPDTLPLVALGLLALTGTRRLRGR